jgi:hypothetical protein
VTYDVAAFEYCTAWRIGRWRVRKPRIKSLSMTSSPGFMRVHVAAQNACTYSREPRRTGVNCNPAGSERHSARLADDGDRTVLGRLSGSRRLAALLAAQGALACVVLVLTILLVAAILLAVAAVSGLGERPRSGLALTRWARPRSSCGRRTSSSLGRINYPPVLLAVP